MTPASGLPGVRLLGNLEIKKTPRKVLLIPRRFAEAWPRFGALLFIFLIAFHQVSCARLFGWEIHAPGMLSADYSRKIQPVSKRVALYLDPALLSYVSKERGGRFADPQTYHVGESLGPMLVEGVQEAFSEFLFFEIEPDAGMLERYGVDFLAVVGIRDFANRVTLKGQALSLGTEVIVYARDLTLRARYEARGTSDARKVFAKKGGPEVNLNAAIERNVLATVEYLQDLVRESDPVS